MTLTEAVLTQIWREVLHRQEVTSDDDFWLLGGDSYGAALVMDRVHERLGAELPVAAMFAAPRLRALARLIDERGDEPAR